MLSQAEYKRQLQHFVLFLAPVKRWQGDVVLKLLDESWLDCRIDAQARVGDPDRLPDFENVVATVVCSGDHGVDEYRMACDRLKPNKNC